MKGTVKLDIPLDGEGEVKASGEASFKDNKVRIASLDLPSTGSQGRSSMTTSRRAFTTSRPACGTSR